jgi:prolyl 4-hydroxylase
MSANDSGSDDHLLALKASEGVGAPVDWDKALDHALKAAESGHALSQATLAGLAGDWALAHRLLEGEPTPADWRGFREIIDIATWKRAPHPRMLSPSPRVGLVEQMASPAVCDWLIARARPGLMPARVYDPGEGGPAYDKVRTNTETPFPLASRDLIFNAIRYRISSATVLPAGAMEAPTILHYEPGQKFEAHHDYLDPASPGYAKAIRDRGQRVLTFLLCLNDDYEGGETDFPVLNRRFKGKKGDGLFFWNVGPEGLIDRRTKHAGLPPTRGEKWMLSQWIRDRKWPDL